MDLESKLKRVKDLLSQNLQKPVTLEEALEALTNQFLKRQDPVKQAERNFVAGTNSKPVTVGRRPLPARVRHEINLRDRGQCTHLYPDGKRCEERRWTDTHLIVPLYDGGTNEVRNLTTLCHHHHAYRHFVGTNSPLRHASLGGKKNELGV